MHNFYIVHLSCDSHVTYSGHEVAGKTVDKVKELTLQEKEEVELDSHTPLHSPDDTGASGHSLQIPLGPAKVEEKLKDLVVSGHGLLRE